MYASRYVPLLSWPARRICLAARVRMVSPLTLVRTVLSSPEGNAKFLALDLQSMQVVFTGDVGKTPDVLDADRQLQRVYVAAESGPLTVFDYSGGGVRELLKSDAGPNADSVAVDPATHHIYLPLENVNGHPVLREMVVES